MGRYREIVDGLIKKSFPGLKKKIIFVTENKMFWFNYSAVTNYFLIFFWIVVHPKSRDYSRKSLTALLAHELSHIQIIADMTLYKKIKFLSWLFSKKVKIKFERDADLMVITKGYGKDLIQLRKESWKGYSKKKLKERYKKGYLSIKEIKEFIIKYKKCQ